MEDIKEAAEVILEETFGCLVSLISTIFAPYLLRLLLKASIDLFTCLKSSGKNSNPELANGSWSEQWSLKTFF